MSITPYLPGADVRPLPPNRPGKSWSGGSGKRKFILHTMESNSFMRDPLTHPTQPERWHLALPHLVCNPNTREVRQHIPFDKAAYSLRDNDGEEMKYVWQVELWGRAANTPNYDDNWYRGVAELIVDVCNTLDIELEFADFSVMTYGTEAPQRLTQAEMDDREGILGHAHFGRGIDTHWDPGMLDIPRLSGHVTDVILEELDKLSRFIDVPNDNQFVEDIEWLAETGITKGSNPPANTEFNPKGNVTREQMAAFLHRFAKWLGAA